MNVSVTPRGVGCISLQIRVRRQHPVKFSFPPPSPNPFFRIVSNFSSIFWMYVSSTPPLIYLRNHKSRKFNWPMLFDIRLAANHPLERNQRYRVLNRAWTNPPMADFHGPSIKRGLSLPPSWEGTSLWTVLHALITATGLTYDPVRLEEDTRTPSLPPRGAFNLCVPLLLATV